MLVGTQVCWEVYQPALSFAVNANVIVTKEIPDAFRQKCTTDNSRRKLDYLLEDALHLRLQGAPLLLGLLLEPFDRLRGTSNCDMLGPAGLTAIITIELLWGETPGAWLGIKRNPHLWGGQAPR